MILLDIMTIVTMEEIPYGLIINSDRCGILDEKQIITAIICGSLAGKELPIYQGTTKFSQPKYSGILHDCGMSPAHTTIGRIFRIGNYSLYTINT